MTKKYPGKAVTFFPDMKSKSLLLALHKRYQIENLTLFCIN